MGVSRRVALREASELLGVSREAVRKRAKRGTLRSDKDPDGTVYVYLPIGEDAGKDADRPGDDHGDLRDELIDELRDRVRALEEANRETRRLLAGALERIPAIDPPETPHAPETPAASPVGTDTPADAGEAQESVQTRRPSWWRRFFGG